MIVSCGIFSSTAAFSWSQVQVATHVVRTESVVDLDNPLDLTMNEPGKVPGLALPIRTTPLGEPTKNGPSIHLPCGRILRTKFHPDAKPETRAALLGLVPFKSFIYHTVSSGRNLVFLMPTLGDRFWMKAALGEELKARSTCEPGTLFLRHDQMCVLTYGSSQDHGSFMPPILSVLEEDLPALKAFGEEVWQGQLQGKRKIPLTLEFTGETLGETKAIELPELRTGNGDVDAAVAEIRSKTKEFWLTPPVEVVQLMSTGDARGLEGTDGFFFPPMVIGNGVLMTLTTYAHSGTVNAMASLFEANVSQQDLDVLKRLVRKVGDANLPYLRSLSLNIICDSFEAFFTALEKAETVQEVQALLRSISSFGALMHGWFVFLFPYRLGIELRRAPQGENLFKVETWRPGPSVPLRSRAGRGLGVATWDVASPQERDYISPNKHLPVSLASATGLPLLARLQSSASAKEMGVEAAAMIEEHLSTAGAILFRTGNALPTFSDASNFLLSMGYNMYADPTGREKVAEGLYHASLAVPEDFNISPHQEHIVSKQPPSKLFLYCQKPCSEGGQTPLANAGEVWDLLSRSTQDELRHRGVRFEMVRGNAGCAQNHMKYTRSWQEHFKTSDLKTAVAKASDQFDGTVRVDDRQNIILRSPPLKAVKIAGGREVYCSQLQNIYSLRWLWGDADEYLPAELLEDIMSAIWRASSVHFWEAGDVLVVHNTLVLHGRLSYRGERHMAAGLTHD